MPKAEPLTLAELNALLPRLQATVELLVGKAAAGGRAAPGRRAGGDLQAELLATLKGRAHGLSLGELASRLGAERSAIKYHLRALRRQKQVRVVGDRKQAKWLATK